MTSPSDHLACKHYGTCGGCTAQGLQSQAYENWKRESVLKPLKQQGLGVNLDALISCSPASRRRVSMGFSRGRGKINLGFHTQKSHDLIDVEECLVAQSQLVTALPALRNLLRHVMPKNQEGKLTVLASMSGLDISIDDVVLPNAAQRQLLTERAATMNAARLTINGDIFVQFQPPQLQMGRAVVTPPPGGFVQAVEDAEQSLANYISSALKKNKCRSAADLFSGCGAFTFRIAEVCRVLALDGNAAAIAALDHAARNTQGLKPIQSGKRDLFRRPLFPHELKVFDAVVLDPPWQGATAQVEQLAKSTVPLIVYVSCNPGSFARDAMLLKENGYEIENLIAVDQFLWSEHVELAATLKRRKR